MIEEDKPLLTVRLSRQLQHKPSSGIALLQGL